MKIVITGISGFRNRGVEALAISAMNELRGLWPDAEFTIVTTDPVYDAGRVEPSVRILRDSPRFFKQGRLPRSVLGTLVPRNRLANVHQIIAALRSADLVIASGGDIFSSDYGIGLLKRQLGLLEEAQRAGRKTVFLAHSIGPFKTAEEVALIKPFLEASTLVTARESFTRDYLVEKVGLARDRVHLTSDVAFLLQPSPLERTQRIAALVGLPPNTPYIALGPSEGITSFSNARDRAQHDDAWLRALQHFLQATPHPIVLVPHVQDASPANDDAQLCFRLLEKLGFPDRVRLAAGPLSARDYKGLIAGADFFMGERMHACIAALSTLVPSLVIGYSVKARGIMRDIFDGEPWKHAMISVADFVAHGDLPALLQENWEKRDAMRHLLTQRMPVIKERAGMNYQLLKQLVADKSKTA